ncbi:hypothetical protein M011DRAFT_476933 [Sporormia fimetaria CBS 119925]|uniref:Uncharacterized protein n=1 Tax=Sporormia fimetaria CBS 119925 TaxID=1340428 RepID=A0A6A6VDE8_9PLEO|nr:hypothetical protein M011DRAFT_476933 [Sporormia fimetaria CBS 119925]
MAFATKTNMFSFLFFLTLTLSVLVGNAAAFNREVCYAVVKDGLLNGTIARNDSSFMLDSHGAPMSDPEAPVFTLVGCKQHCGPGFTWYEDIGPRLTIWLIPVFLLLSNMEVSPLDKRRYLMIVHLLGDPVDSLWSFLLKLEAWSRCKRMAQEIYKRRKEGNEKDKIRNLGTLLAGIEELVGYHTDPLTLYNAIRMQHFARASQDNTSGSLRLSHQRLESAIARAAQQLADSRTDERNRTLLAMALYCYQLLSAFVATVGGGNTSPPGGRIGTAMFLTWIVPTILLSNAIGGYTSVRTAFTILESFLRETTNKHDLWGLLQEVSPPLRHHDSLNAYFDSLSWSGAIYTYRPDKRIPFGHKAHGARNPYTLFVLAVSPLLISSIIASVLIWHTPPLGINCRNILIFSIFLLLLFSTVFTYMTHRLGLRNAKHWYAVLVKDTLLSLPTVVLLFLAAAGLFNTCWCWSGVYSLGKMARVPLNPVRQFEEYNRSVYPALVVVCVVLQVAAFWGMARLGREGRKLMRWSEGERMGVWREGRRSRRVRRDGRVSFS